ncbi:hypothetical protein CTRI78_v005882 [Colletotrichum trifolii]|uniref:Uncharacterized protein n=1 Tax=Colletotrichum trifolii TaxID=5466 RepID=A0A4V3HW49_COLTR|nr:hypothetical protein CTRI78_v005882 [Colletotrichum trifolii]
MNGAPPLVQAAVHQPYMQGKPHSLEVWLVLSLRKPRHWRTACLRSTGRRQVPSTSSIVD